MHAIELTSSFPTEEHIEKAETASLLGKSEKKRVSKMVWTALTAVVLVVIISVATLARRSASPLVHVAVTSSDASNSTQGLLLQTGPQFFEGDLKNLPPEEITQAYGTQNGGAVKAKENALTANEDRLWPGGVFYIDWGTSSAMSKLIFILAATQVAQAVPRVTFIERTDQTRYTTLVTPTKAECWSSSVGRWIRPQEMGLSDACSVGTGIHEIMHAMGFWHEQSRPDRDNWLNVLTENIDPDELSQFSKRQEWETNDRGSPFDYGSIMQYPAKAFSINGLDTLTKRVNKGPALGQRNGMSWEDIYQMNAVYPSCDSATNLAAGKSAFQSSTSSGGVASRGVDGNSNNNYGSGSCTHTTNSAYEWWAVDLGAGTQVCNVVLTNREDCCSDRLQKFDIFVTDTRPTTGYRVSGGDLCVRVKNTFEGTKTFSCEGIKTGRYLGVQLRYTAPLTLCEVKAYGPPLACATSIFARGKSAFQSSTSASGSASRAVDGNVDSSYGAGSCSHTANENYPWWTVDLTEQKDICGVVITNRGDCCSERLTNFDIFVTDRRPSSGFRVADSELCRRLPASFTFTGTETFNCLGVKRGRYVGVQIRETQPLTICEFEIRVTH